MTKKQAQAKYEKMLKDFDEGHRKLKKLKEEMRLLRIKIQGMPNLTEERPDELIMKDEAKS